MPIQGAISVTDLVAIIVGLVLLGVYASGHLTEDIVLLVGILAIGIGIDADDIIREYL